MAAQGRDQCAPVGFDEGVSTSGEFVDLLDRDHAEQFANMDMVCREEIVEPPNPRRELWLGEDPSAAQAAQSVGLSEAAGDDELASEVERRWDGRVMEGFQIDLIDQDARSNFVRQFSD